MLCFANCNQKPHFDSNVELGDLDKKSTYLIFRGTNTIQGQFAKNFNLSDASSSHVGLLTYDEDWKVYNVSDFESKVSDLKAETFDEFHFIKSGRVTYISIWEIAITQAENEDIQILLRNKLKQPIKFDRGFNLNDQNNLYCSEFVVGILEAVNLSKFKIPLNKKPLKGIYKNYFQKDTLVYYPVDVFQKSSLFAFKKEWNLN